MSRFRTSTILALMLALLCLAGCAGKQAKRQRYYDSGMKYFQAERYSEAAIQFANAVQADPEFAAGHYQLAQCYLKQSAYASAFDELLRTVEIQPKHWKAQVDIGNLLLASRQFDKAKERADLVLENNPNDIDARVLSANVQAALDKPDLAFSEMQKAIALDPKRALTWLDLAALQFRFQPAEAEASYLKAISLDPQSHEAVMLLGNYYRNQKRWSDAEAQYRRAIDLPPKDQDARAALGRLYLAQDDRVRAEKVLLEAKQAAPEDPEAYRMFGDYLVATGQLDRAVFEFASLHRLHPGDLRVTKNYVSLLILYRRLLEATKLNDAILKNNVKDLDALMFRGDILTRQGKGDDAVDVLSGVLKSDPQNGRAHYLLGNALLQIGNLSRAQDEWREALRLRPDLNDARRALAGMAIRRGNVDLLDEMINQLMQAEPSNPKWYVYRAAIALAKERKADAEADYRKAISVAPADPIGYGSMGNLLFSEGKLADAQKFYEQALERDPNYVDAMQGLMAVAMQQKQTDKALARVDEQIRRAPRNSNYYTLRGTLLLAKNDFDGAIAAFTQATVLNPNNVDAFALLGQIFAVRGLLPQAIANYERSLAVNPNDARGYVLLGGLEYSRSNFKRAEEMYKKALGIEPDYPLAANNLAYLMLERGENVDVAASLAQVARRGMPDEPTAADTLAWAYYKKGAYNLAIDLLGEALRAAPNNPTYHYHIGLAYQGARDPVRARAHLEKALQLEPQFAHAEEIRKALKELEHG